MTKNNEKKEESKEIIQLKNRDELLAFLKSTNAPYITMSDNTIIKTFTANVAEMEILEKEADTEVGSFTAILSAEIPDSAGDIVVQDGISFDRYEHSQLPLLHSHDDEKIAGVITKVWRTTAMFKGEKIKVTKVKATFNDSEYGKYWQAVQKSGLPIRLSLGALVKEAELIKDKKDNITGILYKKSEAIEGSAVAVPANPAASEITKDIDKDTEMTKEQYESLIKSIANIETKLTKLQEMNDQFSKSHEIVEERLDEIASKMTTSQISKENPAKADESNKQDDDAFVKKAQEILEILKKTKK